MGEAPAEKKIVTSFCGMGWIASREDWDEGMPCGTGLTEKAAIDDLIEKEEMEATE